MSKNFTYADYLGLDKVLSAQQLQSVTAKDPIHDEMLFIIVHQSYELWFKQLQHELNSINLLMDNTAIAERDLTTIVDRTSRMILILKHMVEQISILETMTPMDFLDFRQYLGTSSGFQSKQFRALEITLGLKSEVIDRVLQSLPKQDYQELKPLLSKATLFTLVEQWLEHMPFLEFDEFNFWDDYQVAINQLITQEKELLEEHILLTDAEKQARLQSLIDSQDLCVNLFNPQKYQEWQADGRVRLSQRAMVSALFIFLYRHEPILYLPFKLLNHLMDIDEQLTAWRSRHLNMVQRMIGDKIGTGGSSGAKYLQRTLDSTRIYKDLCNLSNFLIPQSGLPRLPDELITSLDFKFNYMSNS